MRNFRVTASLPGRMGENQNDTFGTKSTEKATSLSHPSWPFSCTSVRSGRMLMLIKIGISYLWSRSISLPPALVRLQLIVGRSDTTSALRRACQCDLDGALRIMRVGALNVYYPGHQFKPRIKYFHAQPLKHYDRNSTAITYEVGVRTSLVWPWCKQPNGTCGPEKMFYPLANLRVD